MAWHIKLSVLVAVSALMCLSACVTDSDMLEYGDLEILEIKNSNRFEKCRDLPKNMVHSDLINLDGIVWERLTKNGNVYSATSTNPHGNDMMSIELPIIFDNTFTEYACTLTISANQINDEKLLIKGNFPVAIDSRSDTLKFYLCDVYYRGRIANQSLEAIMHTSLFFTD